MSLNLDFEFPDEFLEIFREEQEPFARGNSQKLFPLHLRSLACIVDFDGFPWSKIPATIPRRLDLAVMSIIVGDRVVFFEKVTMRRSIPLTWTKSSRSRSIAQDYGR